MRLLRLHSSGFQAALGLPCHLARVYGDSLEDEEEKEQAQAQVYGQEYEEEFIWNQKTREAIPDEQRGRLRRQPLTAGACVAGSQYR